jgi:hypothetical protein
MISEKGLIKALKKKFQGEPLSLRDMSNDLKFPFDKAYTLVLDLEQKGIISVKRIDEIGRRLPVDVQIISFMPPRKESLLKHPLLVYIIYPLVVTFLIWAANFLWKITHPPFINISPQEIVKHISQAETHLQQQRLAKELYIGKYVQWNLKIEEVIAQENGKGALFGGNILAIFDNQNKILSLRKDMIVIVSGRVNDVSGDVVKLEKCRFEGMK